MNTKIDPSQNEQQRSMSEFTPNFIRALIGLTVAAFILIFVAERLRDNRPWWISSPIPFPSVIAGGMTISQALDEYSGNIVPELGMQVQWMSLSSILLWYCIGPTLLLLAWRRRLIEKDKDSKVHKALSTNSIAFVFGVALTSSFCIVSIPVPYIQYEVSKSIRSSQKAGDEKDTVIFQLSQVTNAATQFYILPKTLKGGGNSYEGFVIPDSLRSTENANFEIAGNEKQRIHVLASSKRFPGSTLSVTLDSLGNQKNWIYTEEFQ